MEERDKGIVPVAEFVGKYRFPFRKDDEVIYRNADYGQVSSDDVVASIFRVQGDTRIDELLFALENIYQNHIKGTNKVFRFFDLATHLCYSLGYATGRLKRLMEKSRITWCEPGEDTSAHYGNAVIFKVDDRNLGVGLVDLDSACKAEELTKYRLYHQQQGDEYRSMSGGFVGVIKSFREIGPNVKEVWTGSGGSEALGKGFSDGYWNKYRKRNITNKIPLEVLVELLELVTNDRKPINQFDEIDIGTWESNLLTSRWNEDSARQMARYFISS